MVNFVKLLKKNGIENPEEYISKYNERIFDELNNPEYVIQYLGVDKYLIEYLIKRIKDENEKGNKIFVGIVKGIRTDAWTGEEKGVDLIYYFKLNKSKYSISKYVLYFLNGVTGYEGYSIESIMEPCVEKCEGLIANAGTKEKWDKLLIPHEEEQKIRNHIRDLKIEERI